jgi:hypothetical protein
MAVISRGALRRAAGGRAVLRGICLAATLAPVAAQGDRPAEEALASLQERGRLIALYFQAVDKAADLLKAQGSGLPASERTVVIPEREGWRVVFLEDPARKSGPAATPGKGLAIVAETTFSPDAGQVGALARVVPPRTAPASIQSYARCLEQAERVIAGRPDGGRPSLEALVREKDDTFTAYVITRPQEESGRAAPAGGAERAQFGGDFTIRFAAACRQVLSVEKVHDSLASMSLQPRPPGAPLLHEHDEGELPAPMDVALVLRHRVLAPLLVLTPRFMFRVDREGAVTWLGPNPNPKPAASPAPPGRAGAS